MLDNTGLTDNTAALQALHDALPSTGGEIVIPADATGSVFKFAGPVIFTKTVKIDFKGAKIRVDHPANTIFNVTSPNARNSKIENFEIGSNVARTGGYYFALGSQNVEISHFWAEDYWRFAYLDDCNSARIAHGEGDNPVAESTAPGSGFAVVGAGAPCSHTVFENLYFTARTPQGSQGFGILLMQNDVVHLDKVSLMRHGDAVRIAPDGQGKFCNMVMIDRCNLDTSTNGLKVQPSNGASTNVLRVSDTWTSVQSQAGIILNASSGQIQNVTISGGETMACGQGLITHGNVQNLNIVSGDFINNAVGVQINPGCSGKMGKMAHLSGNGTNLINNSAAFAVL